MRRGLNIQKSDSSRNLKEIDFPNPSTAHNIFEDFLNNEDVIVFLWNGEKDRSVEFVSENITRFGYTPEEFVSGKLYYNNIIESNDLERVESEISDCFENRCSSYNLQYRIMTRDGDIRWVDERTLVLYGDNGEVNHQKSVVFDITERKLSEIDLKASEEKYSTLIESGIDGILIVQDEIIKFANRAFENIIGYKTKEIVDTSFLNYIPVEYQRMIHKKYDQILKTEPKNPHTYEVYIQSKSDDLIPVEINFSCIDFEGKSSVMLNIRDITERKEAEFKLNFDESCLESLLKINQMTDFSDEDITNLVLDEMTRLTQSGSGYIVFFNGEDISPSIYVLSQNKTDNVSNKQFKYSLKNTGLWEKVIKQKHPIVSNNISADFQDDDFHDHLNIKRLLNIPISNGDNIVAVGGVFNKNKVYDKYDIRRLTLILNLMLDIIQKRNAENALKSSEEKYSTLVENGIAGNLIIQEEAIKFVNRAFENITGYDREDIIETSFLNYISVEYQRMVLKKYNKILKSNQKTSRIYEVNFLSKTGELVPTEINYSKIQFEGKPAVMLNVRDITKQKQKEQELIETYRMQDLLEDVINNSPAIVFIWRAEKDWPVEYVSENIIQFGYIPEDFTSERLLYGDIIHPDDLQKVRNNMSEQYGNVSKEVNMEYRILTSNDEVRWVDERTSIRYDEHGEAKYLQGIIIDITKKKQADNFLRVQKDTSYFLSSKNSGFQDVFDQYLDFCINMGPIDSCGLYLIDEVTGDLNLISYKGFTSEFAEKISHYTSDTMQHRLFTTGHPIYKLYSEIISMTGKDLPYEGLRATGIIPVKNQDELVAVLFLASHNKYEIPQETRTSLETIANQLGETIGYVKYENDSEKRQDDIDKLLDAVEDFIFVLDFDGHILYTNRAFQERLGYTGEELQDMNIIHIHSSRQALKAASRISDVVSGDCSSCDIPLIAKDGTVIYKETKFANGEWNGQEAIIGISREINNER
ncbi:MAG: PAS domain S-box protein [Methanohalobium sp.]|uniref:PAS domain S-box protein n=1 Tax=Methanohalobium sp. TaxID=2837493 RepID=UPI00397A3654